MDSQLFLNNNSSLNAVYIYIYIYIGSKKLNHVSSKLYCSTNISELFQDLQKQLVNYLILTDQFIY